MTLLWFGSSTGWNCAALELQTAIRESCDSVSPLVVATQPLAPGFVSRQDGNGMESKRARADLGGMDRTASVLKKSCARQPKDAYGVIANASIAECKWQDWE